MDVFYAYAYSSSAWLAMQGLSLLATPKLILTLLLDNNQAPATDLEAYLSRSLGFSLLAIALLTVLLTGSVPLASPSEAVSTDENDPRAPYAALTLLITTLFHGALAFYNYTWYISNGQAALGLGMVGSTFIAAVGLWCLLFGTSKGRINRKTGADKRTSGFPFKNVEADKRYPGKKGL